MVAGVNTFVYIAKGQRKMANCYDAMRAALRRNIEGLTHLSDEAKEALLEQECSAVISASEAGRPFVDIYGPEQATDPDMDYEPEAPAETRQPTGSAKARGWGK